MLLNLCTIILPFLLSCTNRRCANLPRMSVRVYGSMKRNKEKFENTKISLKNKKCSLHLKRTDSSCIMLRDIQFYLAISYWA